jgi:hypothetical protein
MSPRANRRVLMLLDPEAFLLIMSARPVVAECCRDLQIPQGQRVTLPLYRPPLQGIACGLGSN